MKVRNWDLWIGVWSGILIISVVNIVLIIAGRNQPLYDWYILGVSIIVLIVITLLRSRSKIQ